MEASTQQTFTEWLAQHRNGLADTELTELLETVVQAVSRSGKKNATGAITLKIKFRKSGDMVEVVDLSSSVTPDETEGRAYFIGRNGELTRKNPLQPSLLPDPE